MKKGTDITYIAFILLQFTLVKLEYESYDEGYLDIRNSTYKNWHKRKEITFALNLPWELGDCVKCHNGLSGSGYNTAKFFASAAAVAVEDINNNMTLLQGYKLRYIWNENLTDTHCHEFSAINGQLRQINYQVDGFVGFICACVPIAKNAAAVNKPFVSMSCTEPELSDKKKYPTFARTTTLNVDVVHMIKALMEKFQWKKFAVLYERSHMWEPLYEALKRVSDDSKSDLKITLVESYDKVDAHKHKFEDLVHKFEPFLDELPSKARIVLLLFGKGYLRQFLLQAEKKGLNDGNYVYIAINPFASDSSTLRQKSLAGYSWILPWRGELNVKVDPFKTDRAALARAYQSLITLMPETASMKGENYNKYLRFQQRVRDGMSRPPFNTDSYTGILENSMQQKNKSKPPPEAEKLYDAVMLYALGLNETLKKNQSITNGTAVIDNIKGLSFQSVHGSRFVVTSKADVQFFFNVLQFQFTPEQIKELAEEDITKKRKAQFLPKQIYSMKPVCKNVSCSQLKFVMQPTDHKVQWHLGSLPPDEPKCGFYNEKCPSPEPERSEVLALVISMTVMGVIIIILPVFLYRNYHLKRTLKSQLWKIDPNDLFFHDWRSVSTSSLGSLTSQTLSIDYESSTRQRFTTVAIYKGTLVAVKKINKKNVELSKSVLMELKQIRDVRHDNLNQFIGASIEANNVYIITQYATKGSLQDVLENPEIRLDTLFILSLVYDIIKGMLYLHSSTEIKSHGNLKSSNCVIDSRWVLKITDFGLNTFRSKQGTISSIETEPCNNLLWRAPELLRLNIPPTSRGSQKGDVYSFGIILQECHTRDGAWGSSFQDAEAIIERVKRRSTPAFRPVVPELVDGAEGLRDVMKRCWAENPEERPQFSELRKDVEVMMKNNGLKTNIFDNMIYMMGKYSDDLEEIVEERTSSLIEEKHKVEALLERMLPKSVARQLMKGKEVEAEAFEEVTIYFSDIVGFTNICSLITPMEVVDMLNSLYTMFDNVTHDYDVYKVETIGDAYMVVSGLPIRNGKQHAKEIALLALDILENVKCFKIKPSQQQLMIRIGIHTGPVVAGVVGTTMPRYCLFGDTVNVAARMESHGQGLRIHVSCNTNDALTSLGGFHLESRGATAVKGKGDMVTYWLNGCEPHLVRKKPVSSRRDINLYSHGNESIHKLLRDSPRLRHKLHLTPDYLPRTPPLAASTLTTDNLPRRYRKGYSGASILGPLYKKKGIGERKHPNDTHVEFLDMQNMETSNLLLQQNTPSSSPHHNYAVENGNVREDGFTKLI